MRSQNNPATQCSWVISLCYSVSLDGVLFDGGDDGAGLCGDVRLGGESSEAGCEVPPAFLDEDG